MNKARAANRPKKEPSKRVLVTIPPSYDAIALKIGRGNRSKGMRIALDHYAARPPEIGIQ